MTKANPTMVQRSYLALVPWERSVSGWFQSDTETPACENLLKKENKWELIAEHRRACVCTYTYGCCMYYCMCTWCHKLNLFGADFAQLDRLS